MRIHVHSLFLFPENYINYKIILIIFFVTYAIEILNIYILNLLRVLSKPSCVIKISHQTISKKNEEERFHKTLSFSPTRFHHLRFLFPHKT